MNQADVSKLVSKLKIGVNPTYRRLKNPKGSEGRLYKLRQTVTGLIKYERIELHYNRADEARGYAERLISEAIRHGDTHTPTMEMADFWLEEKSLVHKLFKVLAPRYESYTTSYTRMFKLTPTYPVHLKYSVLELKGNPYPPLLEDRRSNRNLLHNVLLDAARREYNLEQNKLLPKEQKEKSEKSDQSKVSNLDDKLPEETTSSPKNQE